MGQYFVDPRMKIDCRFVRVGCLARQMSMDVQTKLTISGRIMSGSGD